MTAPAAAAPAPKPRKKITIPMLNEKKKNKEPIVQLAVYDYENAIIADRMGIDILCARVARACPRCWRPPAR